MIIGNSAAAIGGVQGIRKVDKRSKIVLVADEPYSTYSRPLISYWLEGRVDREHMVYRNPDFYRQYGVDTMLGTKVTSIDPAAHSVTTDDGKTITYEQLLIATGSNPFVPPIEGKEKAKNAFTFTTFDDAQGVKKALKPDAKVVIMGGGLIGLKAAEALIDQVASLTIVDLADRVMPSVLDAEVAQVMQQHLTDLGNPVSADRRRDVNTDMTCRYNLFPHSYPPQSAYSFLLPSAIQILIPADIIAQSSWFFTHFSCKFPMTSMILLSIL